MDLILSAVGLVAMPLSCPRVSILMGAQLRWSNIIELPITNNILNQYVLFLRSNESDRHWHRLAAVWIYFFEIMLIIIRS